jgi:tRNA-dihydrouridine synthase 3
VLRGLGCRFSGQHIDGAGRNVRRADWKPLEGQTSGRLDKLVQTDLRKRNYQFQLADSVCEETWDTINSREKLEGKLVTDKCASEQTGEDAPSRRWEKKAKLEDGCADAAVVEEPGAGDGKRKHGPGGAPRMGPVSDEDLVRLRPGEGRRPLDWEGKAYLAPLTTVGNLPFRRVCKALGADITCGEMALTLPLLQGHTPEWALTKRHHSEDFFGIQVAGCSPPQMARLAQLVEERVDCDFVDINMGCPIDLVFKQGMGSGLMGRRRPMEAIVRSMSRILSCPLTVKMRTGIYSDKHVAHQLFPLVEEWGAAALTLHGRSKEQRYTRLADWDYIGQARATVSIPVFGNGDVMNYEDFNQQRARSGVAGVMLARGALIKPWVFTEIREQRHWDISGQERLDIVRDYCNFGLEHWGSDDKGVETTRRFLLEWLSFTYRYVPHGLLLFPPQRIHERAPLFSGRTELESLLSSPDCGDWVKITEMFLGKVSRHIMPKHYSPVGTARITGF